MAGRGPIPKDPSKLAGHGASKRRAQAMHVLHAEPVEQPDLPATMPDGRPWPDVTRQWWAGWAREPIAASFIGTDWSFLLDTALLHAALWGDQDTKVLPELRLRLAKMGATPEDRARLRIQVAGADRADEQASKQTARDRRASIRAVDPTKHTGPGDGTDR